MTTGCNKIRTTFTRGLTLAAFVLTGCRPEPQLMKLQKSLAQEAPQTMSIEITSYCSASYSPSAYKDFQASNLGTGIHRGLLKQDSDLDGIVDDVENAVRSTLGLRPDDPMSVADPFGDLVIYRTGIYIADQARLRCNGLNDRTDNDHDGLLLCEERLLQTDPDLFDTDGDGIADSIELRCGLNPKDRADAYLDSDGDGISNAEECKINTPIDIDNTQQSVAQLAYHYKMERKTVGGNSCLVFSVSNIALAPSGGANKIRMYFTDLDSDMVTKKFRVFDFSVPQQLARHGLVVACSMDRLGTGALQGTCETR